MKKLLVYLMMIAMLLGMFPAALAETEAAEKTLPAVGDVVAGFEVKELGTLNLINAPTVLYEHIKTGALLYCIMADDINRTFEITFRTPGLDDTGTPHVFEHATLGGSKKYPHQNITYSLFSQAYTTYMNAFTADTGTSYPISSLSEEQLFALADFYMDGAFNPMILSDERLFRREAWRYELNGPEEPIAINGTVYSEMKGVYTLPYAAGRNLQKALFGDSIVTNNTGGNPDAIPEMTYQQLVDFHGKYYHPSNAMIILYGDLDYERFMKHFDEEYLSKYDRAEVEIPDYAVEELTQPADATFAYPLEANSPSENASTVNYGFALGRNLTNREKYTLNVLAALMNREGSPLIQLARERLPGINFTMTADLYKPQPTLYFTASNVNESDKETVKSIVEDGMNRILEEGFDMEVVDAILASERFSILTIPESPNIGNAIATSLSIVWSIDGSLDYYNSYLDALDWIEKEAPGGLFEAMVETYLVKNNWRALTATVPVPGMAEEKAAALAEKLDEYKASLTEDEILALVDATAEMTAFGLEETPRELLEKIQVVSVDSLPEEVDHYDVNDREENGARYLTSEANVGGISMTLLTLDTSDFALEDLHYLKLYASLCGELDTEKHTKEELETLIIRYLNNIGMAPATLDTGDDAFEYALTIQWMSLNGEYGQAVDLIDELLFMTKYDNVQDIVDYVGRLKASLKQSITSASYSYQVNRAWAVYHDDLAYITYLNGLDYYRFLVDLEKRLKDAPDEVVAKLEQVKAQLNNRVNAKAIYAGNAEGIAEFESVMPAFFARMDDEIQEPANYAELPRPAKREALVVDSTVQYNLIYAPLDDVGMEDSGKLAPLSAYLDSDYQMTKIRNDLGAYGTLNIFNKYGLASVSYRDPGIAQTFAAFEETGDFLRASAISQTDIDRFIISSYSTYAMPVGALNGAIGSMSRYLDGKGDDYLIGRMKEAKAFTIEDIHAAADAFDRWAETGARSTSGGAAAIEAERDLYDEIIYLNELDQ